MTKAWAMTRLGDVLTRSDETTVLEPDREYREITVKLWGKGVIQRGVVTGAGIAAQRRYVARPEQFILSRIDARNGALGIVPPELDGAVVTNDFPVFEVRTARLLPEYLGWMCRTRGFVEECKRASEGTTNRVRLQEGRFLERGIPLPTVAEQRRVVARIEALAEQILDARGLRKSATEDAVALLASARRHFMSGLDCEIVPLEQVCTSIIDNLHSNPRLSESGIPCIRSPDVGYGSLNVESAQRTDDDEYRRRTIRGEPQADDIVFVREGGGTGKCAVVMPGQRFSLGQRVMMLRPNTERILPRFLLHQLLSPLIQEDQIGPLCKGSASPHLNISSLKRFDLRVPTLSVQNSVVAELEGLEIKLNAASTLQSNTAAELDALLPAILDRAFKGELV